MLKKKLLLVPVVLLMSLFSSKAQDAMQGLPIDKDTQLITYQEVVHMAGTADELYIRCIEWINTRYKNPADVCRVRNRESGVIEILHRFELINDEAGDRIKAGTVNYTLKLEFKPGRYRYTLSDLTWKQSTRFPVERWMNKDDKSYSPLWGSYLDQVNRQSKELIDSLKTGMEPVAVKQEEKW